ncbi:hypothetical protein GBA65_12615 [Rubrobacter marinus]|uniref:Uncharacterized protein n=1 Tax=Rubrobacter marinus TaxID=2653852 RepID=A0A6G8PYE3_9ACTN|nr:hypothetical protein [Rubrobacter marinus]QIN79223.1 hypothetical protein GBA65_12615 [Rubrobacter marinus]
MIQVQVEVESGAGRFLVSARAASIGRALSLVCASNPGATARVVFPIEPDPFFVREVSREGLAAHEAIGSAA